MGHALDELWRTVVKGGKLIDLRPLAAFWPIDVITPETCMSFGTIDGTLRKHHDDAADRAMAEAARKGRFRKEYQVHFTVAYYWDTVTEMQAYAQEQWNDTVVLPESLLARIHEGIVAHATHARIRVRRSMIMACYLRP